MENTKNIEMLSELGLKMKERAQHKEKKDMIENVISSLVKQLDVPSHEVVTMRKEAHNLFEVAEKLNFIADQKEKQNKQTIKKKDLETIKKVLLEALGIKAEFVDILVSKGNPEEIREVAANIKKEAENRLDKAEITFKKDRDSKQAKIAEYKELQTLVQSNNADEFAMQKYISLQREVMRAQLDNPVKEMCEEIEGHCKG